MPRKYIRKNPNYKYHGRVGAPPGGRVHWFLLMLNNFPIIKRKYKVIYNYEHKDYVLKLVECKKGRADMFLIKRTPRTWSVRYFDEATALQEQNSFPKPDEVIDYILYMIPKKIEREEHYEDELQVKQRKKKAKADEPKPQ